MFFLYWNYTHQCSLFKASVRCHKKTTTSSRIKEVFCCYVLRSRTHQGALAFTPRIRCGPMRPRPPRQVVWVKASSCLDFAVHLWSDHLRRILLPRVQQSLNTGQVLEFFQTTRWRCCHQNPSNPPIFNWPSWFFLACLPNLWSISQFHITIMVAEILWIVTWG